MPHGVCLGVAVQKKKRRTVAPHNRVDVPYPELDALLPKRAIERHFSPYSHESVQNRRLAQNRESKNARKHHLDFLNLDFVVVGPGASSVGDASKLLKIANNFELNHML